MKDVYRLLQQKEADLARVRREIEALQFIASMDGATQAVQQELATWICPKCNHQYSRKAAESVDWTCEDCAVPLLDATGQFKGENPTKPAAANPEAALAKNATMPSGMRKRVEVRAQGEQVHHKVKL
jgi:ribosomal protein L37AE/L43A